jgi:hypothetical protein
VCQASVVMIEKIDKACDTIEDINTQLYNPDITDNLEKLINLI